ncbi:tyrosine-type recombinase/integrase [Saccharothrix syringae]|uniref:Site-specific integrase n=1 Tax=Saccharothrix syringae TaxID=103733 RepID=A0A5Q0HAC8_SACSY|nr:site-specific integrase [Saccharothrix syringae]QFZ22750.1 site-specific integrase [Saccharothrix syringae]
MSTTHADGATRQASTEKSAPPPTSPPRPTSWPGTRLLAATIISRGHALPTAGLSSGEALFSLKRVLAALEKFPGQTWQERWLASGCDTPDADWMDPLTKDWGGISAAQARQYAISGLTVLLCLDVIRPSYDWLHTAKLVRANRLIRELRDPGFEKQLTDYAHDHEISAPQAMKVLVILSKVMMHTGRSIMEITPDDLVEYQHATMALRGKGDGVDSAWEVLIRLGGFPKDTLPFRQATHRGQRTTTELIDYYDLKCQPVRDLLIRYLDERAPTLDYSTLRQLAYKLAYAFWQDLEDHHPGISSLDLPAEVATAWKKRVTSIRTDPWPILMTIRAFYLDIAHWATYDAYWAPWASRCPVSAADTKGQGKHKKKVRAKYHQRTRSLTPHLPRLLLGADEHLAFESERLALAQQTPLGETFSFRGQDYEHTPLKSLQYSNSYLGTGRVWLRDLSTGERIDQTQQEDFAFWSWAAINTFYYTGMRLEELSELTSTALFTYRLPETGEVLPLLQVVPSKTDAERILMVPPELAHVLARVKHRVRADSPAVPLVVRFDYHEKKTSAPLPFLFQRRYGVRRRVISAYSFAGMITRTIARAGIVDANGEPIHVTPHDFRRMFATEAVSGGLPIHIVAKLLGHESLATTEGYAAVYPEDVVRHYRSFITRRRAQRPSEEYRDPTDTEWEEFHQHFRKRKVELGNCGRGYGTPCQHEHACIRCPMLRPDASQRARLEEIVVNLQERLVEARERGWFGEVEGIEVSISAAQDKLAQMTRQVNLGLPGIRFGQPETT